MPELPFAQSSQFLPILPDYSAIVAIAVMWEVTQMHLSTPSVSSGWRPK